MENKKVAIYSRKSKFTGKGESIENQIELCKTYIKSRKPDVTDSDIYVYEDEGYSGKNTHRPQFQQMMSEIKKGNICTVVCYRLDRISRNVADCSSLLDELTDYGVEFCSISENFDTSIPMGRAMYNICSTFAQLERETIAERIRDNMHELAKTGRWLGGNTPTGYKSEEITERMSVDGKKRKAYKLTLIPDEAKIVKKIFSLFYDFNSLTKVETYLIQHGIKSKNGKNFTRFTIKAILQNPVYLIADNDARKYFDDKGVEIYSENSAFDSKHGIMAYNKTVQRSGKSNLVRDIDEWIVAVGKHLGIIHGAEWVSVQKMLDQNSSKSYHKPRSNTALLSGLLVCGNCGAFMRPKMYNTEYEKGEKRFSYLCETKEKSRRNNCDIQNPNGNVLDRAVCEEIKKLSENDSQFIRQLEKSKSKITQHSTEFNAAIENLKKEISDKENELGKLVKNLGLISDKGTVEYIAERIKVLRSEIEDSNKKFEKLNGVLTETTLSNDEFDILKTLLKSFAETFETMSIEQKRKAIRTFVKRIVWDGKNIHMYLYGSDTDEFLFSEPLGSDSK